MGSTTPPPNASTLTYADLETNTSSPKELSALYAQSKVPLQRLFCAKHLSCEVDDDIAATALKLSRDVEWTVREAIASRLGVISLGQDEKRADKVVAILLSLARDIKPEVRNSAAQSLARVPNGHRLVPWLSLTRDKDPRFRAAGAECLGWTAIEANKVPRDQVLTFIFPELLALAKEDINFSVRKTACQSLARLCQGSVSWPTSGQIRNMTAECLLLLATDAAWPVRRAVADAIPSICGNGLDKKYDAVLSSALIQLCEHDTSQWVKHAAKRSLGPFLANSKLDSIELLNAFVGLGKSEQEEARYACAYFLPGVLQAAAQPEHRWNEKLKEIHSLLSMDVSARIRRSLAHSLHFIAKCIGSRSTEKDLVSIFTSFLADMDDEEEIRLGVIRGAAAFLSALPSHARMEAFERLETTRVDISTPPLASLAVSRDARLSLASQLPAMSKIIPAVPGLGKMFLSLAKDEAHHIREKALDSFGEIVPVLDCAEPIMKEFEQMASSPNFWNRWAFVRGTRSMIKHEKARKLFEGHKFMDKIVQLQRDPVLTVRTEALACQKEVH